MCRHLARHAQAAAPCSDLTCWHAQDALQCSVGQVPRDVLVAIMQLLSQPDRDRRAGLVSRAWLEAAMAPCHWPHMVDPQVSCLGMPAGLAW